MLVCVESKVPSHCKSCGSRTVASAQGCCLLTSFCGIFVQPMDMNLVLFVPPNVLKKVAANKAQEEELYFFEMCAMGF